jgi:Cu2+-containing amine oxidase
VIRSHLAADWYRYTSEWHLAANGTIMPRWGFAGVRYNIPVPCVCKKHHHHIYWRIDFDIETSKNNVFRECNSLTGGTCTNLQFEKQLQKQPTRRWEIGNPTSGNHYQIFSGSNDGKFDPAIFKKDHPDYPDMDLNYGVGDLWLVRYDSSKLAPYDDGYDDTAGDGTRADFSKMMTGTGASVVNQDVVVWYSAHFMHDQMKNRGDSKKDNHVVGPDLVPGKWA